MQYPKEFCVFCLCVSVAVFLLSFVFAIEVVVAGSLALLQRILQADDCSFGLLCFWVGFLEVQEVASRSAAYAGLQMQQKPEYIT